MGYIGREPSVLPITSSDLANDIVSSNAIADDSISEEHIDNTAITGFGALTSLADTDKFLVSDASDSGNLKYVEKQYLPSGGLNFVTSATSSSNHNEVAIDNCFTSTYENYLIIGNMTVSNTGDVVRARMRDANGTISTSGSYVYSFQKTNAGSSTFDVITSTADSNFTMTSDGDNDEQRVTFTFKMYLFDPLSAAKRMGLRLSGVGIKDNGTAKNVEGAGQFTASTVLTGIVFYPSSNQFKNSTIRVYGLSNS